MSWSWSHTREAYQNTRENLERMAIKDLVVIMAEWDAFEPNEHASSSTSQLNQDKYEASLLYHQQQVRSGLSKVALVNSIWDKAEQLATCTNGGHMAWMCPFGCTRHMVSFSTWKEQMDEARQRKRELRVSLGISPCGTKTL